MIIGFVELAELSASRDFKRVQMNPVDRIGGDKKVRALELSLATYNSLVVGCETGHFARYKETNLRNG